MRLLLLLGAVLLALWWVSRWLAQADPARVARLAKWIGAGLAAAVGLWLAATGRLNAALVALGALLPLLMRWRTLWQRAKAAAGPASGRVSTIETRFLRMSLEHDTGVMSGLVLNGRFRGRRLNELSLQDLLGLLGECQAADEQSAAVLEAYLDRVHGDWRSMSGEAAGGGREGARRQGSPHTKMTAQEAYEILGLEPGAPPEQVKAAHRRLMQKLHPDRGGSTYLAAKINQAKDVLLGS